MRKRQEIEGNLHGWNDVLGDQDNLTAQRAMLASNQGLLLEVLLDIRDLLDPAGHMGKRSAQ